jgi:hypothetical protein
MSLETSLERIATALEKLAGATMHIAGSNPTFANSSAPEGAGSTPEAPAKQTRAPRGSKTTEPATTPPPAATPAPTATTEAPLPYDILRANVIKLAALGSAGNAAAVKVLTEFGVKKASEAPDSKWGAMNDRILEEYAAINAPPAAEDFA